MLTVLICDDNKTLVEKYKIKIKMLATKLGVDVNFFTAHSGEQLLFMANDIISQVDIILLDVLMGKMTGIETANALRKSGYKSEIIFLTSSEEYIFDSFDSSPIHYLLKGSVTDAQFTGVFKRAITAAMDKRNLFFNYEASKTTYNIPITDIRYFEVTNRTISIYRHSTDEISCFYSTIAALEKSLAGKGFFRVHRSYIVNLRFIERASASELYLIDGAVIPVGGKYFSDLSKALAHYGLSPQ